MRAKARSVEHSAERREMDDILNELTAALAGAGGGKEGDEAVAEAVRRIRIVKTSLGAQEAYGFYG